MALAHRIGWLVLSLFIVSCAMDVDGEEELDEDYELDEIEQSISWCNAHPLAAPDAFFSSLANTADYMPHVPDFWGNKSTDQARCMAKIACNESDWQVHATNGDYRGMYQIDVDYFPMGEVTYSKYWNGGRDRSGSSRTAMFWQHHAAFQYALGRYGTPCAGWQHKLSHGWW